MTWAIEVNRRRRRGAPGEREWCHMFGAPAFRTALEGMRWALVSLDHQPGTAMHRRELARLRRNAATADPWVRFTWRSPASALGRRYRMVRRRLTLLRRLGHALLDAVSSP